MVVQHWDEEEYAAMFKKRFSEVHCTALCAADGRVGQDPNNQTAHAQGNAQGG